MTAQRITLSRAKGWRMPENTVKVDRSTLWGNPWKIGSPGTLHLRTMSVEYQTQLPIDQISAVEAFRLWLVEKPAWWQLPPPDMFTTRGWEHLWADLNFQRLAILTRVETICGKNLACWCAQGQPCHADVLLEMANR